MYSDDTLIELVRARPCLYDVGSPNYKRDDIKSNNWREIGQLLSMEGMCMSHSHPWNYMYYLLITILASGHNIYIYYSVYCNFYVMIEQCMRIHFIK